MKRRILMSLMVFLTIAATTVIAQPDFQKKWPKSPPPEVAKYLQDNVFPVMKIQQNELYKDLSAKEKSRIAEIRTELKKMHEARLAKRQEMTENSEKPTVDQRKEMREMRIKMSGLMDEVEIIAENHDATISRLFDEIGGEIEQWKADLGKFRERDCPQGLNCPNSRGGKMSRGQGQGMCNGAGQGQGFGPPDGRGNRPNRKMENGRGMGPGGENHLQRLFTPEGLLLWNSEEPLPFFAEAEKMDDGLKLSIFPNPTGQNVQISMMLSSDSKVAVTIIDKNGNEIQQIKAEQASKGLFTKTLDVSKLNDGLYFIRVKAGEESALERLIIKN